MPEGDNAWRAAAGMVKYFSGRVLDRVEFRVPDLASSWLYGVRLVSARAVGKHILVTFRDADADVSAEPGVSGDLVLRFHLGMDGTIAYQSLRQRPKRPEHSLRLRIVSGQWQMLGFELRSLALVAYDRLPDLIGHLGPSVLADSWSVDDAERAIANLVADGRPAHVALLEQRNVAGAGNIYANEVLFLAGVSPFTALNEVTARRVVGLLVKTMRMNLHRPTRSFTGKTAHGENYWVYTRPGKDCRRCGGEITMGHLGARSGEERMVFWCAHCQR